MIVAIFTVVIHLEFATCHLGDAVVDFFTGIYGCFKIGVLE
jgi:hypothetical protein